MIPAIALALLVAAPALAQKAPNRVADLAGLDSAKAQATAAAIGFGATSADPPPPAFAVTLAPSAAHTVQAVGFACTGQRVAVDPAPLLARLAPPPAAPAATLHIASARAFRRCVSTAEFALRCLTTVEIEASLESADGSSRPLAAAVTRDHDAGLRCRHIPEATALATREALIALLAAATPPAGAAE